MLEISQRNLLIKFLQFSSCKPGSCTKKGSNIKQSVIYSMHNQKVPSVEKYEKSIGCTKKEIFVNLTVDIYKEYGKRWNIARYGKSRKHASIACRQFLRKLWTFLEKNSFLAVFTN